MTFLNNSTDHLLTVFEIWPYSGRVLLSDPKQPTKYWPGGMRMTLHMGSNGFSVISPFLERILMEDIEPICSSES